MKLFINTTSTRPYNLKADEQKEFTFYLGAIDSLVMMYLGEKYINAEKEGKNAAYMTELVRFGLKKIDGLKDDNDNPIEMPTDDFEVPFVGTYKVVAEKFIKDLHWAILVELSAEISNDNVVSGKELKN